MTEWVAVGGLVVAGISLLVGYLDRRESRSEGLRSVLYQRQFDAIEQVADLLARLEHAGSQFIAARRDPGFDSDAQLTGSVRELRVSFARYRKTLPRRTLNALADVLEASAALEYRDDVEANEKTWGRSLSRLDEAVRRDLGVDRLGDRIRQVTGAVEDDRIDAMTQDLLRKARPDRETRADRRSDG